MIGDGGDVLGGFGHRGVGGRQRRVGAVQSGAGTGVVVTQHHPDRSGLHGRVGGDRQPAQLLGNRLRAKVIGLCGQHLAGRHDTRFMVADRSRCETRVGQCCRHRGGKAVDIGGVHHLGGRLARCVRQFLGLAFVLLLQQAGDPLVHLVGIHPHHALHAVVAPAVLLEHRDGGERDVARRQLLQLLGELHDVPTVGQHDRTLHRLLQPVQGGRAGQRLAGNHFVRKGGHHHLLTHHPVQVAAGQVVPLPDEAQRLRTVQLLPARREVGPRKGFVHILFQADVDSAERVGDQREAEQADLGVVVDGDAGQVGDGLDQRLAAGFGGFRLRPPRGRRPGPRPISSTSRGGPSP